MADKLPIFRGDDVDLKLTVQNDDGSPFNLTGTLVCLTARLKADDPNHVIYVETSQHTEPLLGKTVLSIPHTQTEVAPPGLLEADVRMRDSNGKYTTLGLLSIRVKPNVSRLGA
jgi:hypothetical protein